MVEREAYLCTSYPLENFELKFLASETFDEHSCLMYGPATTEGYHFCDKFSQLEV